MKFLEKLRIKLVEKSGRRIQDTAQKASLKCPSVCYTVRYNPNKKFFCYHAMKYDVTYPILIFGTKFNVTKNRQDHLIFEMIINDKL